MNFFSRQKTRTPAETVRSLKENIVRLDQPGSGESKKRVRLTLTPERARCLYAEAIEDVDADH